MITSKAPVAPLLGPLAGGLFTVTVKPLDPFAKPLVAATAWAAIFASEIAVGTEPAFRGRGLARRIVATASRSLVSRGQTAVYVHVPDNVSSAAVAEAAGFRDLGWTVFHLGGSE